MGRGLLLLGFALATFASQAIWVTFSPVSTRVAEDLGVGKEDVGFLALLYPVLFLLLTIPSGILLDRDFKKAFLLGVILTGASGLLRLAEPNSYMWLLVCQLLGGIGQPFILNAFVPFSNRIYPDRKETVVSMLSLSMYLGIIYALGSGYTMYSVGGITGLISPIAAISLLGVILVILNTNIIHDSYNSNERWRTGVSVLYEIRQVTRFKDLWMLGAILGLGVALFDNMSIWLEAVLAEAMLGHIAGRALALALIAGLVGISLLPTIITKSNSRTVYIRTISIVAAASFAMLALKVQWILIVTLIPLIGFLMLPAYPIIMEWIATYHNPRLHGSATGFIGFISRVLTVILASTAIIFINSPTMYFTFLTILALTAFTISLLLPKDR